MFAVEGITSSTYGPHNRILKTGIKWASPDCYVSGQFNLDAEAHYTGVVANQLGAFCEVYARQNERKLDFRGITLLDGEIAIYARE